MNTLTVFGFRASTYVRTVLMTCEEKQLEYTVEPLEFGAKSHLARHPFAKMPVLQHGDIALFETLAITHYIDGLQEAPALIPAEAVVRSRMLQWISAANDYGYMRFVAAVLNEEVDAAAAVNNMLPVMASLDNVLATQTFLANDALSLADLFFYPMLSFAQSQQTAFGELLTEFAPLQRWFDGMTERSSAQRTAA